MRVRDCATSWMPARKRQGNITVRGKPTSRDKEPKPLEQFSRTPVAPQEVAAVLEEVRKANEPSGLRCGRRFWLTLRPRQCNEASPR
jgi:hypothetical protein